MKESDDEHSLQIVLSEKEIAPWLSHATMAIKRPKMRLHNEIIEFYDFLKPKKEEYDLRVACYNKIKRIFECAIPGCCVVPFGSFASKLYLPHSDIDIVLLSQAFDQQTLMAKAKKVAYSHPSVFCNIAVVKTAKVPLIKCVDTETGVDIDISFNEISGVLAIKEYHNAIRAHPELKYLIMLFKLFLRQRHFHNSFTGGIGSFLLFCMVLSFLRQFKKDQISRFGAQSLKEVSLGEYVLEFMNFYGSQFDCDRNQILLSDGGRIIDKASPTRDFSLISPYNDCEDIGAKAFRCREIFAIFRYFYRLMLNTAMNDRESVLKCLINPLGVNFIDYLNQ